jgi:hypothetical protein
MKRINLIYLNSFFMRLKVVIVSSASVQCNNFCTRASLHFINKLVSFSWPIVDGTVGSLFILMALMSLYLFPHKLGSIKFKNL